MQDVDTDSPMRTFVVATVAGIGSVVAGIVAVSLAQRQIDQGASAPNLLAFGTLLFGGGLALAAGGLVGGATVERLAHRIRRLGEEVARLKADHDRLRRPVAPPAAPPENPRLAALREERNRLIEEARSAGRDADVVEAQIQFITHEFEKKGVAA